MNEISAVKSGFSAKKKLIIALVAVVGVIAIAVSSVFATVAYLTFSSAVSNTFTIGNIGITMDEGKVNSDGQHEDGGVTRVDGNSYHLIPGKSYDKDPVIHVHADSEDSYIFVVVRNDIKDIAADTAECPTIHDQMLKNGWALYGQVSTGPVYVYVGEDCSGLADDGKYNASIYPVQAVHENTDYPIFSKFYLDKNCEDKLHLYGGAKVTVTAYAIQDDGFNGNADQAWAAIVAAFPFLHTGTNNTGGGTASGGTDGGTESA